MNQLYSYTHPPIGVEHRPFEDSVDPEFTSGVFQGAMHSFKLHHGRSGNHAQLVRVNPSGEVEEILVGLVVPTAMTIGPDGAIYISNFGAPPPGAGQILRLEIND